MTTGLITPTEGQETSLDRIVADAIRSARKKVVLDKDAMQRLLGNGGKFQDDILASLIKYSVSDDRFELVNSFDLTVPKGYVNGTQLTTFAEYAKQKSERFYYYNGDISDKNYAGVTNQLVPGKTYGVKIFAIKRTVASEDCLSFLASQNALLIGAQGLSLIRQLKKDEFPVGKYTVSFDKKEALWEDADGNHRVPRVDRDSDGDWGFYLGYFGRGWRDGICLLCFCDLSA